jgi:hypothetical protein
LASSQFFHAVNKERNAAFNRKNAPIYELKFMFFHKWSKHVVKVEFWRFFKKLKSPETRLFQGFFDDFKEKMFGLVNAVSRSVLQRFFV